MYHQKKMQHEKADVETNFKEILKFKEIISHKTFSGLAMFHYNIKAKHSEHGLVLG